MLYHSPVQTLELRRLLSGSFASLNPHGTLSVVGTGKGDAIMIASTRNQIVARLNGSSLSFAREKVKRITARGFGGSDKMQNETSLPCTLAGDEGNDVLTSGPAADDLQPGSGINLMDGGGGKDVIDYSDQPARSFDIENDPERLPAGVSDGLEINRQDLVLHYHGDEILGTPHNDGFSGGVFAVMHIIVNGGDGNDDMGIFFDELYPENNGDAEITIVGGNGNDSFATSDEAIIPDKIIGGNGNDFVDDDVFLADDPNAIDLGSGHDHIEEDNTPLDQILTLYCGPGVEDLNITSGGTYKIIGNNLDNNIDVVSFGGSTLIGGAGNDTLDCLDDSSGDGAVKPNFIFGGDGNDRLIAGSNFGLSLATQTVMKGENGNDTLDGSGGANRILDGGAGNDLLYPTTVDEDFQAGLVKTTVIGGAGRDTADFSYETLALTITLDNKSNDGVAGSSDNVHNDIETIIGGSGNDSITAGRSAVKLIGNVGNDTLIGGSANDTLLGGAGNDILLGNGGNDILFAQDNQRDTLDGGSGFDQAQRDKSAKLSDQVMDIEAFL